MAYKTKKTSDDFDRSDRPSKRVFTASTTNYLIKNGYNKPFEWLELDENGNLVPFDSPEAKKNAREDVFLHYGNAYRAFECKEVRKYPSDIWFKVEKGVICDTDKFPAFDELYAASGIPTNWVEIYPLSDDIRIWPLYKMDKYSLDHDDFTFNEITIDPDSPLTTEDRGLLPVSKAITIPIIKNDQQGDS